MLKYFLWLIFLSIVTLAVAHAIDSQVMFIVPFAMVLFPPLALFFFVGHYLIVYSLPLLPLVLSIDGYEPRRHLAATSIAAIAIVAIVPGMISRYQFQEMQSRFQTDDVKNPVRTTETKVFRVIAPGNHDGACNAICAHLLIDGGVDKVLLPLYQGGFKSYRIGDRKRCKSPGHWGQGCLYSEYSKEGDADVEIRRKIRTNERDVRKVLGPLMRCEKDRVWAAMNPMEVTTIEVSEFIEGVKELAERRTVLAADVIPLPFVVSGVSCGQSSGSAFHLASQHLDSTLSETLAIIERRYALKLDSPPVGRSGF